MTESIFVQNFSKNLEEPKGTKGKLREPKWTKGNEKKNYVRLVMV